MMGGGKLRCGCQEKMKGNQGRTKNWDEKDGYVPKRISAAETGESNEGGAGSPAESGGGKRESVGWKDLVGEGRGKATTLKCPGG